MIEFVVVNIVGHIVDYILIIVLLVGLWTLALCKAAGRKEPKPWTSPH